MTKKYEIRDKKKEEKKDQNFFYQKHGLGSERIYITEWGNRRTFIVVIS